MEIRSAVLVRFAKEIVWIRKHNRERSPSYFESLILPRAYKKNVVYLGFVGDFKGSATKILLRCESGHVYVSSISHLINKAGTGCRVCKATNSANRYRKPSDVALKEVIDFVAKNSNWSVVGFEGGYVGSRYRNLILKCPSHDIFRTTHADLMSGYGCPSCGRERLAESSRKPVDVALEEATEEADRRGGCEVIGFKDGYKKSITKNLVVRCFEHGNYTTSHNNFVRGVGCPSCAESGYRTNKKGYVYIQLLTGEHDAVKFGITNRLPEKRLAEQNRSSKLNHELVFTWSFEDGSKALSVEKHIKKFYKGMCGIVPREVMADGYTETLPIDIYPELIANVRSLCQIQE
ncbi:hypothetical protein GV936_13655 [Salmonella enterica]|nr:hypothetical protein [Salmonella enterica]